MVFGTANGVLVPPEDAMPGGHSGSQQKVLEKRRGEKRHGQHPGHLKEQLFESVL